MKKVLKWGGIIMLVLIVLGVIGSMGDDEPQKVGSKDQPAQSSQQTNTTADETTVYAVGDQVQMGDVILTVNKVETSNGGQFTSPSEDNHWVELNLTLQNTGSDQEFITTLGQMFVIDDESNQYQVTVTGKRMENAGSMGLDGALIAKAKKTDWVGFEVPKDATGLKLQYNASFWNNKNILVDLGM